MDLFGWLFFYKTAPLYSRVSYLELLLEANQYIQGEFTDSCVDGIKRLYI